MSEQHQSTKEKEIIYLQPAYPCDDKDDEIDLLDLWNVLWQGKWLIALVVSVSVLVAGYMAFFYLPVTYKSEAVAPRNQTGQFSPWRPFRADRHSADSRDAFRQQPDQHFVFSGK
ncbi:MAG: hypothetical protein HY789_12450 [Deltaproteobacteria bacterium]|nr:hypothetical protein [Deltaproteobacteria bacterium]